MKKIKVGDKVRFTRECSMSMDNVYTVSSVNQYGTVFLYEGGFGGWSEEYMELADATFIAKYNLKVTYQKLVEAAAVRYKENADRMKEVFNSDLRVAKEEYERDLKALEFPYEVGREYTHLNGCTYLMCSVYVGHKVQYVLICSNGKSKGHSYSASKNDIKGAFCCNESFFTPLG